MPIVESLITALIVLGALAYLYKAFRPKPKGGGGCGCGSTACKAPKKISGKF